MTLATKTFWPTQVAWTEAHRALANAQGWDIQLGDEEAKVIKHGSRFASDEDAWQHVLDGWVSQDLICKRGVAIVFQENFGE